MTSRPLEANIDTLQAAAEEAVKALMNSMTKRAPRTPVQKASLRGAVGIGGSESCGALSRIPHKPQPSRVVGPVWAEGLSLLLIGGNTFTVTSTYPSGNAYGAMMYGPMNAREPIAVLHYTKTLSTSPP